MAPCWLISTFEGLAALAAAHLGGMGPYACPVWRYFILRILRRVVTRSLRLPAGPNLWGMETGRLGQSGDKIRRTR